MGFIKAAFIRKNTPELRKELTDLGYHLFRCIDPIFGPILTTEPLTSEFLTVNEKTILDFPEKIDCGENEELFLAIAALRDDSDWNQWFVYEDKWFLSDVHDMEFHRKEMMPSVQSAWLHQSHKATTEELTEYFKK